jgi:hypothetical protein
MPGAHRTARSRWSPRSKVMSATVGTVMAGATAFAATNWVVGLNGASSAEGQSATITNLTIAAVATPSAANLLFPGANGDVVLKISNPNAFPVTLTAVQLPANTAFAAGYGDSALSAVNSGCTATNSGVGWNFATASSGSSHTLASPLTVGANDTLTVTMTNAASMSTSSPAACAGTYFSMPSLTGVSATGGAATATAGPATDSWTS